MSGLVMENQDTLADTVPLLSSKPGFPNSGGYSSTADAADDHENDASSSLDSSSAGSERHLTSVSETFLHLLKGYIGSGMLSLPWAVSQLGLPIGFVAIFVMSYWSSYNCWTVVRIKRYIERTRTYNNAHDADNDDDKVSETGSSVTTNTNMTYPDVGEWAYGKTFHSYVSACICTQQLAICTVFVSFIGENLEAVLKAMPVSLGFWQSHVGVMSMVLPFVLSLSFIPSLKGLTPIMAGGTILLVVTLTFMVVVGAKEWEDRPTVAELPGFKASRSLLALCAILYSYEGICLILPIESAMQEPKKFAPVFAGAMALVAFILASFSCCCVVVFGEVTNGSITAFLMSHYESAGEEQLTALLLAANTAISFSVLLTYPLQLFPAVELLGPSWSKVFGTHTVLVDVDNKDGSEDIENENDLTGFDPLPPLPEHDTFAEEEEFDQPQEHMYDDDENKQGEDDGGSGLMPKSSDDDRDMDAVLAPGSNAGGGGGGGGGTDVEDSQSIRSFLSSAISFPNQMMPKMVLPGDSPQLRATLVMLTYMIAVVVPNVQALISLAGALAGSSSALLIPPVLELAWLDHLEHGSTTNTTTGAGNSGGPPLSPSLRALQRKTEANHAAGTTSTAPVKPRRRYKYLLPRLKNYGLLAAGTLFMCVGTYASISDIVKIYWSTGQSPSAD